eukprot:GHVL01002044.1.p1 GENE.GHVL01002044.1~~GHVL01002044.1.p1  ORF type:complete len:157 (-),score=15.01 GHVL01002044.1:27-497(-)
MNDQQGWLASTGLNAVLCGQAFLSRPLNLNDDTLFHKREVKNMVVRIIPLTGIYSDKEIIDSIISTQGSLLSHVNVEDQITPMTLIKFCLTMPLMIWLGDFIPRFQYINEYQRVFGFKYEPNSESLEEQLNEKYVDGGIKWFEEIANPTKWKMVES